MKTKKIKLTAVEDKAHITYDALSVLHKYDVGLIPMEAYAYVAYIKLMSVEDDVWGENQKELQHFRGGRLRKNISFNNVYTNIFIKHLYKK